MCKRERDEISAETREGKKHAKAFENSATEGRRYGKSYGCVRVLRVCVYVSV